MEEDVVGGGDVVWKDTFCCGMLSGCDVFFDGYFDGFEVVG